MARVWKIILVIIGIALTAYFAACVVANLQAFRSEPEVKYPEVSAATHSFTLSTGMTYLSSDYEQLGATPGGRTFILNSYYERSGMEFKFRNRELVLDEKLYGAIEFTKRQVKKPAQ